jgi:hypothetical protein
MGNIEKVSELLGIVVAKQVGDSQYHDCLKGNRIAFSEVSLKKREKPGKFLLPHGMPPMIGEFAFSSRVIPKG